MSCSAQEEQARFELERHQQQEAVAGLQNQMGAMSASMAGAAVDNEHYTHFAQQVQQLQTSLQQ